ncbi:MAG: hypothetical protein HFI93_03005 [Lachnospiraceae bacterium]|nr:hypothetical protein [Lachnospiraceae bacterium]
MKKGFTGVAAVLAAALLALTGCQADQAETSAEVYGTGEQTVNGSQESGLGQNEATGGAQSEPESGKENETAFRAETEESASAVWEEEIEKGLVARFSVPDSGREAEILHVIQAEFDVEDLWKMFSSEAGTVEETDDFIGVIYQVKDALGGDMFWSSGSISYRSKLGKDIGNMVPRDLITEDPETEKYELELSGFSRETAREQILRRLAELLPELEVKEARLYAMTADTLREYREKLNDPEYYDIYIMKPVEFRDEWSAEEEVYYFEVSFSLGEDPVRERGFVLPDDTSTRGMYAYGYIGKNGFEYFTLGELIFRVEESETQEIISWEQAYQAVKDYFSLIILDDRHVLTIDEVKLEYVVMPLWDEDGHATVFPVWVFSIDMEGRPDMKIEYYVNALTGEKMN